MGLCNKNGPVFVKLRMQSAECRVMVTFFALLKKYLFYNDFRAERGQLYDLKNDPEERVNLYHDERFHAVRDKMIMRMLDFKCMHHYGVPEIYKECLKNEPPAKL